MSLVTHTRIFFGEGKHNFKLTAPLILELERSTGLGIGTLAKRIFSNDYHFNELAEVIRLGLIGGGETPQRADELTKTYVHALPVSTSIPTALEIMNALFFGVDPNEQKDPE